jgi:hypothetical protein
MLEPLGRSGHCSKDVRICGPGPCRIMAKSLGLFDLRSNAKLFRIWGACSLAGVHQASATTLSSLDFPGAALFAVYAAWWRVPHVESIGEGDAGQFRLQVVEDRC